MLRPVRTFLLLALGLAGAAPALAAWPSQPALSLPVIQAPGAQGTPVTVTDGAGGVIVVWIDPRSGPTDLYATRVLASGSVDPTWPTGGLAVCSASGDESAPVMVPDGAGGAIVAWVDPRSGNTDIYAQHVLANGTVDPAWPANGRALCTDPSTQTGPAIAPDGAGGAIIAWRDSRVGLFDLFIHHVRADGTADPAWTPNGNALCIANSSQSYLAMLADGLGGVFVTWGDLRSGAWDIYAQHVLASGAMDPAGTANGNPICTSPNSQVLPQLVSDGQGGALVAWPDARTTSYDIYAHRLLPNGTPDPTWPVNGAAVCTVASEQSGVTMVSDGAGGAILVWQDYRLGNYDLFAGHLLATGAMDPAWTSGGVAVCAFAGHQNPALLVSDGAGGALAVWSDGRNGTFDIYAHHLLASGVLDPAWSANGNAVSYASGTQSYPTIVADGTGGFLTAWLDDRNGDADIYAQRVGRHGYLGTPEPVITSVTDVPNDQGGKVKLSWAASYLDLASNPNLTAYDLWRSVPPLVAAARLKRGERPAASFGATGLRPGTLVVTHENGVNTAWEYVATQAAYHYVANYSYLVPTAQDWIEPGDAETAFMVVARNGSNSMYWPSLEATGHSVDNLAPLAPSPFTGNFLAGATHLHWNPNLETDVAGYRLYRGDSPDFVPGPASLVSAQADTGYTDVGSAGRYYKLSAVDIHGNESATTLLSPIQTADVGVTLGPLEFTRPAPDPAVRSTTMRFTLPHSGRVELNVWDAAGRRVRSLLAESRSAGSHSVSWDLRGEDGGRVAAGVYFVRLEFEGRAVTRRVVTLR